MIYLEVKYLGNPTSAAWGLLALGSHLLGFKEEDIGRKYTYPVVPMLTSMDRGWYLHPVFQAM